MHAFVVGNITIDETIAVAALPSTGASIFGVQRSRDIGGKGANQAIVMARCGLPTTLVAAVGEDHRAASIRQRLSTEPVVDGLIVCPGGASDYSVIFNTPDGDNAIVTTTDAAQALTPDEAIAALASARPGDLLVMQGNLVDETTRTVLEFARRRGLATAFNPSPVRPAQSRLWDLVDIVFFNEGEAKLLTGTTGQAALGHVIDRGVGHGVLTLGSDGALLGSAHKVVHVAAEPSQPVDTTGAGDTFMGAALASAFLRSTSLDARAMADAAAAAAITVAGLGTLAAFPTREQLSAILART